MTDRPILRWPDPSDAARQKSGKRNVPKAPKKTPGARRQGERLRARFDPLFRAFEGDRPTITLREDPTGIAPERALVFETAAQIQNFAKVAREAGLEVFAETSSGQAAKYEEGDFAPPDSEDAIYPTLYATMPTEGAFRRLLTHWRAYQRGQAPKDGLTPWWRMFDMLIDLRPWGPEDRFPEGARAALAARLPQNEDEEVLLELEIWPSARDDQRAVWRDETKMTVNAIGGRIVHESSIRGDDFIYEALLAAVKAGDLRALIDNPFLVGGLASLDGLQFILPQTIAQAIPVADDKDAEPVRIEDAFDAEAPIRAVLFDGVPVAAHPAIDGGVVIEDVHDIEPVSILAQRFHGTAMASLILRGDIDADGEPLHDSRLLSVPVLIDDENGASSPRNRLFVDVVHMALTRCFLGNEPLAPDAFVVNLSIGVWEQRFAGRISALARLIDWWSWKYGVLFVVSAGNIPEDLPISGVRAIDFEDADHEIRQAGIRSALSNNAYERALLSPGEALNALTVGATSEDLSLKRLPTIAGLVRFEGDGEQLPQMTSAMGLGPSKALKPDLLLSGGAQEIRILPASDDTRLRASGAQRTGLVVASPAAARGATTTRCRGTSPATALATRAILQTALALTQDGGPYQGLELPRTDLALATRALAVNASIWPEAHAPFEVEAKTRLGADKSHTGVKDQVARHFGYGILEPIRMTDGPINGATLVGFGRIRKDQGKVFELSLPPSLSGQKQPRFLRVTLAWFSPIAPARALYRCAALDAICANVDSDEDDKDWSVKLRGVGPDSNMAGRGTVWSRRLAPNRKTTPAYEDGAVIPIRVQCREVGSQGLSPDDDVPFAIAASFEVEGNVQFDVYQEIKEAVRLRVGGRR